jgi:hypothetical protein
LYRGVEPRKSESMKCFGSQTQAVETAASTQ